LSPTVFQTRPRGGDGYTLCLYATHVTEVHQRVIAMPRRMSVQSWLALLQLQGAPASRFNLLAVQVQENDVRLNSLRHGHQHPDTILNDRMCSKRLDIFVAKAA